MANVTIDTPHSEITSNDLDHGDDGKITFAHCVALVVLLLAIGRMVTYFLSTFGLL